VPAVRSPRLERVACRACDGRGFVEPLERSRLTLRGAIDTLTCLECAGGGFVYTSR